MRWVLKDNPTEITMNGVVQQINPGDGYPGGYTGSKYSIRRKGNRYSFSLKSYSGNFVQSKQLPEGILRAINSYKPGFSGSMRIRWNGDTILASQNNEPALYIGKMTYQEGSGLLFPGLDLKQDSSKMGIYSGPQSAYDIGEPWSVPALGHIRPKLTRRFKVDGFRERINTRTTHTELIDYTIYNLEPNGKRFYITNFGQVVTPITIGHIQRNNLDLKQEVENLAKKGLDTAVRFCMNRIERTHRSYGKPWVMFCIGNVDRFIGPQPDLSSGPEYDLSDEGVKRGEGD